MEDPLDGKHPWISLLLIAILVAVVLGVPLGFVAVLYTWTGWMWWAVPLALGAVIFGMGATILTVERLFRR